MSVSDIAYVRYEATDLSKMENFLIDFGLQVAIKTNDVLYMRAANQLPYSHITHLGKENKTLGVGFIVETAEDLKQIASKGGGIVENNPEPAGGQRVRFIDPAGFVVDVLHGYQKVEPTSAREETVFNTARIRQRLGKTIRLQKSPSTAMRLGHAALLVKDFNACFDFYSKVLGFTPSDSYFAGVPENTIASFMHCGLGDKFTDHHTIALITSPDGRNRFDHTAFEVIDLDDLVQGSEFLKSKNYVHSWGVGRHIQGSQLFDYWRDPFGNKIEHWTDGDLVNAQTPVGHSHITNDELSQWAPELKQEFFA
jgi:catechol 2,3-dioxygenase-like lactoylglutathione lyase family enzyme